MSILSEAKKIHGLGGVSWSPQTRAAGIKLWHDEELSPDPNTSDNAVLLQPKAGRPILPGIESSLKNGNKDGLS